MPIIEDEDQRISLFEVPEGYDEFYQKDLYSKTMRYEGTRNVKLYNEEASLLRDRENHFKSYSRSESFSLSDLVKEEDDLFSQRQTRHHIPSGEVELASVAKLLHSAYREIRKDDEPLRRSSPSGGARYPIEIYLAAYNVKDLEPALYHYNIREFSLEKVNGEHPNSALRKAYEIESEELPGAFMVLMTAAFDRVVEKYGVRGWRYLLLDAGHLGQNLFLSATSLGLSACPLGAVVDHEINEYARIQPYQEIPVLSYLFGASSV